jgi:uroporphyrinogen-III synthase
MAKVLSTEEVKGKDILFPRAAEAREEIVTDLKKRGARMVVLPIYRALCPTYTPEAQQLLFSRSPQLLTFASSSTANNFSTILKSTPYWEESKKISTVAIGPVTAQTLKELGFTQIEMAREYTIPGMIQTIVNWPWPRRG